MPSISRRAGWKWDPPRMPMKGCERKLAACAVSGRFAASLESRLDACVLDQLNDYKSMCTFVSTNWNRVSLLVLSFLEEAACVPPVSNRLVRN